MASVMLLTLYRAFPLPRTTKAAFTRWLFSRFERVFRGTALYEGWLARNPAQRARLGRGVQAEGASPRWGAKSTGAGTKTRAGNRLLGGGVEPLVIVHAFYPDLLPEILERLATWPGRYELHVTTSDAHASTVTRHQERAGVTGRIHLFENRGRDILPFLQVARSLTSGNDRLLLKLHTKRSLHRVDGEQWRHDLLGKLAAPENAGRIVDAMSDDPGIGMVGPEGHVLSLASFWGSNRARVEDIARRLGLPAPDPANHAFVAGSMFWTRGAALRPLLELGWEREDFEPEAGQLDGTLAHAIERGFALSLQCAGLRLTDTSDPWTEVATGRRVYLHAEAEPGVP